MAYIMLYIALNGWMFNEMHIMWRETVAAQLRRYPGIYVGGMRKKPNSTVRVAGQWAEIRTRNLFNAEQECYLLNHELTVV